MLKKINNDTEWRVIPEYSNYEISEHGQVRKAVGIAQGWRYGAGTEMKACFRCNKQKYMSLSLVSDQGRSRACKIHQLVTAAWHGPRPSLVHCALHKDDDRHNNHYSNLYWGTKRDNAIDRSRNGRGRGKLNMESVLWIRELYHGDRRTYEELAEMFGVKSASIAQVIRKVTYTWV